MVSNFYIGNEKVPLLNGIMRFAIRARNDTLWTPAKKVSFFGSLNHDPYCKCGNGRVCNLLHILNNCSYHMVEMTRRRNMMQEKVREAVRKHRNLRNEDFRNNQTVNLEKFDKFNDVDLGEFRMLRPDLQFWVQLGDEGKNRTIWKLFIVEFAIPFDIKLEDVNKNSVEK
jgi:hypothetical protein